MLRALTIVVTYTLVVKLLAMDELCKKNINPFWFVSRYSLRVSDILNNNKRIE
jgi:hypothetical protein